MTDIAFHRLIVLAALVGAAAVLFAPEPVTAQQSRYSSDWRQTGAPAPNTSAPARPAALDALVKELDKLTREAERVRAADPRFLADLKDLVRRYSWPWRKPVAADDFRDGDFSRNPQWTVSSGFFTVQADGLVTTVAAQTQPAEPTPSTEQPKQGSDDLARALLGGVLRELSRERRPDEARPATQPVSEARIDLVRPIPNQFAVHVELQSRGTAPGRLELGVGQGPKAPGYFVVYSAGASPALSLVRKGARGSAVIDVVSGRATLEDGRLHTLLLTRDATGDMTLSLDGETKFRVRDRAFRSPFDRFVISNGGGDYAVRSVAIYGAPDG